MLLQTAEVTQRRRDIARSSSLTSLQMRLARLLDPLIDGRAPDPQGKARLTRHGGVCPSDGARLIFDPLEPDAHRCPRCGGTVSGRNHHEAWLWRYHLWLSERAIHCGVLSRLLGDDRLRGKGVSIVDAYADLYPTLPNRDNVLGPTRVFFSTYLESIWLAQLAIAAGFLDLTAGSRGVVSGVVEESASLIESFDEGWSNRQVWNNVAMLAAGLWLGDVSLATRAIEGAHGLRRQLLQGVTDDGLWFEGENYHFFALRGFQLAGELLRNSGVDLYAEPDVGPRLTAMYAAPLATAFPDLTVPARGDSPYGVSLRQPRFAELWEVGLTRTGDARVESFLHHLYAVDGELGEDFGFSEIAEHEVNRPAEVVTRSHLGWKALMWMRPDLPVATATDWNSATTVMPDAGIVVLRPDEGRYLSVDCGGHRGGHGHPDLLHLTVFLESHLLADFGTGSYVNPSLHWYRSARAHNAPILTKRGQLGRDGWCEAADVQGGWGWCRVVGRNLFGPGTRAARTAIVGPDYVVDIVEIDAPPDAEIELPVHPVAGVSRHGGDSADPLVRFDTGKVQRFEVVLLPRDGETVSVDAAPGPPDVHLADGDSLSYLIRRAPGAGTWVSVLARERSAIQALDFDGRIVTVETSAGVERIELGDRAATVLDHRGMRYELRGGRPIDQQPPMPVTPAPRPLLGVPRLASVPAPQEWLGVVPASAIVTLGAAHYRRSEIPYGVKSVRARVAAFAAGSLFGFAADVVKSDPCFRSSGAPDLELDNEWPDIHSDGLECYIGRHGWDGWIVVPIAGSQRVSVRHIGTADGTAPLAGGSWCLTERGYAVVVSVELPSELEEGERFPFNLVVNEMYSDRERRAGQLVLSGDAGWAYLRGDREDPARAAIAEIL